MGVSTLTGLESYTKTPHLESLSFEEDFRFLEVPEDIDDLAAPANRFSRKHYHRRIHGCFF